MSKKQWLIDANAFKMCLEEIRQQYLEEDTYSSNFAAEVIETVQDEYLANAPTVDAVEVVHGEWIYENGEWVCSVCKEPALYEVQVYGGGNYKDCDLVRSNYCPNCGAKMDGGNDDG